jgi:NADH:ubiquinone oxidoreductase subunit 4 (subunit M)
MLARAYFGPFNEKWEKLVEMRPGEQFAAAMLIAFILFMGLWPAPFIDRISESVSRIPGVGA